MFNSIKAHDLSFSEVPVIIYVTGYPFRAPIELMIYSLFVLMI